MRVLREAQTTLREQNEILFQQLQQVHHLSDQEMRDIRAIFAHSAVWARAIRRFPSIRSRRSSARRSSRSRA